MVDTMSIQASTRAYEKWLGEQLDLIPGDLRFKHRAMAATPFAFLRATFYRWVELWRRLCPELARAPEVLAVGDLHVENFGTWRDTEGRLIWGVNDFDEASPLAWTLDLVRLATSAHLAIKSAHLALRHAEACQAILEGYRLALQTGGRPYVLAEDHGWLRKIALGKLRDPKDFWAKANAWDTWKADVPRSARAALERLLPERGGDYRIVHRVAGLGSLGRPRFMALLQWRGGWVAREAKALAPSASAWAAGKSVAPIAASQALVASAVRVPDPCVTVDGPWLVRRLAPDCARIELSDLPEGRDESRLLCAMGFETGNVHLGTKGARQRVLTDLARRPKAWLHEASRVMGKMVLDEWLAWRSARAR